jgi:hypothetical protein
MRLCRPAVRKGFAFPAPFAYFFFLRAVGKAQLSRRRGGGWLGFSHSGKAQPFRTASGEAAGHLSFARP